MITNEFTLYMYMILKLWNFSEFSLRMVFESKWRFPGSLRPTKADSRLRISSSFRPRDIFEFLRWGHSDSLYQLQYMPVLFFANRCDHKMSSHSMCSFFPGSKLFLRKLLQKVPVFLLSLCGFILSWGIVFFPFTLFLLRNYYYLISLAWFIACFLHYFLLIT